MKQHFEELKQHYPKTAKALGITADMEYEEWREAYHRETLRKIMEPPRISMSDSTTPLPFPGRPWYLHSTTSTKEN